MRKNVFRLFPNTGHHCYFIPMAVETETPTSVVEGLAAQYETPIFAGTDASEAIVSQCKARSSLWFHAEGDRAWLRGRFGSCMLALENGTRKEVFGLWVGIETATGRKSRGYTFKREELSGAQASAVDIAREDGITPYVALDARELVARREQILDLRECFRRFSDLLAPIPDAPKTWPVTLLWQENIADEPIPVTLVVDFGNSRTMVLGVETGGNNSLQFFQRVKFVTFPSLRNDARDTAESFAGLNELIPESWFLLQRPEFDTKAFLDERRMFHDVTYRTVRTGFMGLSKKTEPSSIVKRMPQQFIDMSPALIGTQARRLLESESASGHGRIYLSSPKRYAWDTDLLSAVKGAPNWTMIVPEEDDPIPLRCELLKFLPKKPENRNTRDPADKSAPPTENAPPNVPAGSPDAPDFCRADSMIWVALRILEHAFQQIQSEAWRETNQKLIPRVLEHVLVTFPPGWTLMERRNYERAWRYACNIFYWSRFYRSGLSVPAPTVSLELDEAIATQLPIIYSEVSHLGGRSKDWIALYGRVRDGVRSVRVLTMDVGGGTTDTSVVEYRDGSAREGLGSFKLEPRVLFTDSVTDAGDALMKILIEEILLPALAQRLPGKDREEFEQFWSEKPAPSEEFARSLMVRMVFIPLVLRWIRDFSDGVTGDPETGQPWTPKDAGADPYQIEKLAKTLRRRGIKQDVLRAGEPVAVDYDRLGRVITAWATNLARHHAQYLALFQCDLVVIGGKPSEMPHFRQALKRILPIHGDRVIFTKGYYAGRWLPLNRGDEIEDAKMVTAIGGALFRAMQADLLPQAGVQIRPATASNESIRNYWGLMGQNGKTMRDVLLEPKKDSVEVDIQLYQNIGRMRLPYSRPDPIYQLRWKPSSGIREQGTIRVRLERIWETDGHLDHLGSEGLELTKVLAGEVNGRPVTLDDVELHLQTLVNRDYWLDSPIFEMRWSDR